MFIHGGESPSYKGKQFWATDSRRLLYPTRLSGWLQTEQLWGRKKHPTQARASRRPDPGAPWAARETPRTSPRLSHGAAFPESSPSRALLPHTDREPGGSWEPVRLRARRARKHHVGPLNIRPCPRTGCEAAAGPPALAQKHILSRRRPPFVKTATMWRLAPLGRGLTHVYEKTRESSGRNPHGVGVRQGPGRGRADGAGRSREATFAAPYPPPPRALSAPRFSLCDYASCVFLPETHA